MFRYVDYRQGEALLECSDCDARFWTSVGIENAVCPECGAEEGDE